MTQQELCFDPEVKEPEPEAASCACGATVRFWSAARERGYCSDECYEKEKPDDGWIQQRP